MNRKAAPTDQRYRVVLTETRVYALEIATDKPDDLETWAREGWAQINAAPDELKLVDTRLEKVSITPADALPWSTPTR